MRYDADGIEYIRKKARENGGINSAQYYRNMRQRKMNLSHRKVSQLTNRKRKKLYEYVLKKVIC